MELSEDQLIRLQICEKCYEHQQYDQHSQNQFQENFETLSSLATEIGLKILRNHPPKYLRKAPNTKISTKRYVDTNTGKIIQFPDKGCFQVYYKSILVYSKLQTAAFPDLPYLCSILKTVKTFYEANPSILSALQKFRDIEYDWKKNFKISQSLYHYIRMNACGNKSEKCINDIIMALIEGNSESNTSGKKKIVYPYLIYDNKEKMQKMESIYCPKSSAYSFFTHRSSVSALGTHKFYTKQKNSLRPQTGSNGKNVHSITANKGQTQRQVGTIVKNTQKNEIFQLVIKQENKKFNEQKFKKWMKQSNLTLQQSQNQNNPSKSKHSQQITTSKQGKPKLWSLNKEKARNNSKEVYVAYLNNLKEKKQTVNNKFQINFKKNSRQETTHDKKVSKPIQNFQLNQKQSSSVEGDLSSSRFGSIRKNVTNRQQSQQEFVGSGKTQSQQKNSDFLLNQELAVVDRYPRISQKGGKQNQENSQEIDALLKQSELIEPATNKTPSKNSGFLKHSKYFKGSQTQDGGLNKEAIQPGAQNQNELRQIPEKNSLVDQSNLKIQSQIELDQTLRDSRMKRASIEEATVQKRINLRKRASNHQRSSQSISKLNLTKQLFASSFVNQNSGIVDPVLDDMSTPKCSDQWNKYIQDYIYCREQAQIIKKIVQEQNFYCDSYTLKYAELILSPNNQEVEFKISGEELTNKFQLISIRSLCKPSQIRLFPQIFKQIECNTLASTLQNSNICMTSHHKSKLMHVVNLMLRSNPMMISRIFQDKKSINPYGVYCIWLRSCSGRFQPVFVNDFFAFEQERNSGKLKPVYSWLSNENSIWYMLLEKAVAKIVGGYHAINELSLAQLMSIIMSSPTVDIGHINPQKAIKVFDEKIFYNKMASIYTLRENSSINSECKQEGRRIDRIIGFSFNKRDPKESAVTIKIQDSSSTISMRQFLFTYGQIALLFFNNNYFLNQTSLKIQNNRHSVLSCRLTSNHSKNNCYLMFSNFPQKCQTKVTLYRQLSDEQAKITEGMNPLSEQDRKYEYIGEIYKTGNFFFQVQVNGGDYICLMENNYEAPPFLSIFSQFPIKIGDISTSQILNNQKQKIKNSKIKKIKRKEKLHNSQVSKKNSEKEAQTPKVLIQHRINLNKFKDEKLSKKNKTLQKNQHNFVKLNKKYAYQPDNLYQIDEIEQEKQNIDKICKKDKSKFKEKKQISQKEIKHQNIENKNEDQKKSSYEAEIVKSIPPKCINVSRIIDDYD